MYDPVVQVIRVPLRNKDQTLRGMYALTDAFYSQLGPLAGLSLESFFDKVRKYPYRRDPKGRERIVSPEQLMKEFPAWDCKKKAIMCAAWLKANRIPYRFVAVSETPTRKIHHVFPQAHVRLKGESAPHWRNVDATYSNYKLFEKKPRVTRAEILER